MKKVLSRINEKLDQFIKNYYETKQLSKNAINGYQVSIIIISFLIFAGPFWEGALTSKGHLFCSYFDCKYWVVEYGEELFKSDTIDRYCAWPIPIGLRIWRLIYSSILMFLAYKIWPRSK
tara:strand:- start:5 stop:364 length:360 start_codon:yes stop_codon:yes gene_type:complete